MNIRELQGYLLERAGEEVRIEEVRELRGEATGEGALKQFGYGRPLFVSYRVGDARERVVLHRIRRNAFGREREDDRAAAVWLDYRTFNRLPSHVPALDMVMRTTEGSLRSIKQAEELLLLSDYRPGHAYAEDLIRIRDEGRAKPLDFTRANRLAAYLAKIHRKRNDDPLLWRRRLRDLVGHGEGIMGLTDSYPRDATFTTEEELRHIEESANRWRWRLKPMHGRLRQVHGDFHPFNVLFEADDEFHLLDRSRGEWGEPADDVSCMSINYLFFSLQCFGSLDGPFLDIHTSFWETYLEARSDEEMTSVIQPWLVWRALVLASPVWYPDLLDPLRRKLLTFARRVLSTETYDVMNINSYLEDS